VVNHNGEEIYIDPTPGADKATPVWQVDKKVTGMPLHRNISGIGDTQTADYDVLSISMTDLFREYPEMQVAARGQVVAENELAIIQETDFEGNNPQYIAAVMLLMENGIVDINANVFPERIGVITDPIKKQEVQAAYNYANTATNNSVAGIFDWIGHAAKVVNFLVQRNAYLAFTSLNVFGNATKLYGVLNGTPEEVKKMRDIWVVTFGGSFDRLEQAIRTGYKRTRILGIGALDPATWGAIVAAAASIIIAAMGALIRKRDPNNEINPATGLPWGYVPPVDNSSGIMSWINQNPLLAGAVAFAAVNWGVLDKNERIV
jgi:hypothetical protein